MKACRIAVAIGAGLYWGASICADLWKSRPAGKLPGRMGGMIYNAGEASTYQLRHELTHGAEGQSWRADHLGLRGGPLAVAVKIIRPNAWLGVAIQPSVMLRRLRDQTHVLRSFNHEGFAAVQVAFEIAAVPGDKSATPTHLIGLLALVMGWIDGSQLDRWSQDVRDPVERVAVLELSAQALDAFHQSTGYVHCDLKPANIMVERNRTRIVDFGLVRAADRLGAQSFIGGSAGYRDPAAGRAGECTPAVDLYSFAGVIYHQLTGRHPDSARSAPQVHSDLREAGFDSVARVLGYSLSPDPARRPSIEGPTELLAQVTKLLGPRCSGNRAPRPAPDPSDETTVVAIDPEPAELTGPPLRKTAMRIGLIVLLSTAMTIIAVLVLRFLDA